MPLYWQFWLSPSKNQIIFHQAMEKSNKVQQKHDKVRLICHRWNQENFSKKYSINFGASDVCDFMVTVLWFWCRYHYRSGFYKVKNRSLISKVCHQQKLSLTYVTNIDVTVILKVSFMVKIRDPVRATRKDRPVRELALGKKCRKVTYQIDDQNRTHAIICISFKKFMTFIKI